nr:immunoglobulin light chain junction region [Macaca mulatta]MOW64042.1 immunoglobulin light chain junction region [Macaca mulatta]MOW64426.1 immunoglobulin light chain junction region [Macaca mulatta]MOW73834.1 immunoglobulin light chain junction region [Macaca mulatta]MOW74187.1 immunoglobulin light chain junction region [Macaca mulatta]
CQQHKSYPYSF